VRALFLHNLFPGPFRALAQALGTRTENRVLFLAESSSGLSLPGVRRLRLSPPAEYRAENAEEEKSFPAEREMALRLRRASRAAAAMSGLRRDGFAPDLVCASPCGAALHARDLFPQAFHLLLAEWFHSRQSGRPLTAAAHVRNFWEASSLADCDLALTVTSWQREQYPPRLAEKIQVLRGGVNSAYFVPAPGARFNSDSFQIEGEILSFSGPPGEKTRGFDFFMRALPTLLRLRPRCRVLLLWPRSEGSRPPAETPPPVPAILEKLPLSAAERARVLLAGERSLEEYRLMLQASTLHLYLSAPHTLSAGLLEAMSCGALVAAPDTPPVREIISPGLDGFLCRPDNPESLARELAAILEQAPKLGKMRRAARKSVELRYSETERTRLLLQILRQRLPGVEL
jgi:glycosyltransferase involved in cell wall biosynthesis